MAYNANTNNAIVEDKHFNHNQAHADTRRGVVSGVMLLVHNALTIAASWGMAAMGGLGIFYSAFQYGYPNDGQCNVKEFITPMLYLIVASSVEIGLAGLTLIPAFLDAVQGTRMLKHERYHTHTGVAGFSLVLQVVNFLLLIFLGVWGGFGGWSFWHSNQGCGPRDLYLFLWAFLITEYALVAFRLYTTTAASVAAMMQMKTGRRQERAVEAEKTELPYNGGNQQYYSETAPTSPVIGSTPYAAPGTAPYGEPQHHSIVVDRNY